SLGWALIVPLLAGFSAWLMCTVQNRANVLQSEQSKTAQWTSLLLSVGLSLYLGLFVPIGVGVYWIFGNFYAILQLSLLNLVISPKKEVDFADLEDSRAELLALQQIGGPKKKWFQKDQNDRREKADYKRFFSIANKKLVFYSERSGYYKYFKTTIESLLLKSNITIHYITSDPDDAIFDLATTHPQIKPYYIGEKKLIFLMMKMDADVVVTTLPDLNQFHLKRSYVRDDVHYVYLPHDMLSTTMTFLKGAFDYYDAIMCVGQHQINELRESESIYHLPEKALIPYGYGLLEGLLETYQNNHVPHDGPPKILIAPSWQFDNIFDSCLDELIESLMEEDYQLILRPHPEYCKRFGAKMARIVEKYPKERYPQIEIELDFSSNHSIYSSDLLITDWSKIAYEFSFCTLKPSLFINTKPKILNVDHERYTNISTEITLRDKVGISLEKSEVNTANTAVKSLLETQSFRDQILEVRDQTIFNLGKSGEMSANYLLTYLKNKSTQKKESK
ncbi:MAG: CDP-glycerol glycerophosphotransferase family protein, partial [Eubacteriales bacterium]